MRDRDEHRRGARAARPLTGRMDYARALLENVMTIIDEARRDADADPRSRWAFAELGHLRATIEAGAEHARTIRATMLERGLSPHALAAPVIPLVLARPAPPFLPVDATLKDG